MMDPILFFASLFFAGVIGAFVKSILDDHRATKQREREAQHAEQESRFARVEGRLDKLEGGRA